MTKKLVMKADESKSASLHTMKGDLPPSSRVTRLSLFSWQLAWMYLPTAVDPVNVILSTSSCRISASPALLPYPGTTFKTPGGNPASIASSASFKAVKGVFSEGFNTVVHPAAVAGAILKTDISRGKFHGTMAPTTPTGSYRV